MTFFVLADDLAIFRKIQIFKIVNKNDKKTIFLLLCCCSLALLAVVLAAYRMRDMRFHSDRDCSLDETLLLVAVTGQFVFCVNKKSF